MVLTTDGWIFIMHMMNLEGIIIFKNGDFCIGDLGMLQNRRYVFPEAYLNRAEAYVLWDNKVTEALKDWNELCRNRIEGYSDVSISDPVLLLE